MKTRSQRLLAKGQLVPLHLGNQRVGVRRGRGGAARAPAGGAVPAAVTGRVVNSRGGVIFGYVDHTGRHQFSVLTTRPTMCCHSRGVLDWLRGPHTDCHQLNRVLKLQKNVVVKSATPARRQPQAVTSSATCCASAARRSRRRCPRRTAPRTGVSWAGRWARWGCTWGCTRCIHVSAWFQPLYVTCDIVVLRFAFSN
jgi:hypothetical protein